MKTLCHEWHRLDVNKYQETFFLKGEVVLKDRVKVGEIQTSEN